MHVSTLLTLSPPSLYLFQYSSQLTTTKHRQASLGKLLLLTSRISAACPRELESSWHGANRVTDKDSHGQLSCNISRPCIQYKICSYAEYQDSLVRCTNSPDTAIKHARPEGNAVTHICKKKVSFHLSLHSHICTEQRTAHGTKLTPSAITSEVKRALKGRRGRSPNIAGLMSMPIQ